VLPFENLSTDKGNEYFADGMQDLILTKLADIGDLKVISRTSTAKYASHPDDLKIIGQQLGVATILEGSVQKAGNQVLINVQLIDVKTDGHIWAESYTRTLDNIFGVEGEVAEKIATTLNAKLTPAETARIADVPTTNTAAYTAFLKGEYYGGRGVSNFSKADFLTAFDCYRKAVSEDPEFAAAWASLASSQLLYFHFIGNDQPNLLANAKAAIDRAFALQPQLEQAYLAKGIYLYYAKRDFAQAAKAFAVAHALKPQDAIPLFGGGLALAALGERDAAMEALQRAGALDPRQLGPPLVMSNLYGAERRYADAERQLKLVLAIDPSSLFGVDSLAAVYGLMGNLDAMQSLLDGAPDSVKGNPVFKRDLAQYFIYRHDWAAARTALLDAQATVGQSSWTTECMLGDVERYAGDPAKARPYYQRCTDLLPKAIQQSTNGDAESGDLGVALAHLGRIKEALEQGQRGMEAYAPTNYRGQYALQSMAQIQAQAGMAQDAVATLDRLLSLPGAGEITSAPLLKINPIWDPIRKDPRFQALLKKYSQSGQAPANSAGMASTAGAGSGDD
jgi:serine/threonine-protein kinase